MITFQAADDQRDETTMSTPASTTDELSTSIEAISSYNHEEEVSAVRFPLCTRSVLLAVAEEASCLCVVPSLKLRGDTGIGNRQLRPLTSQQEIFASSHVASIFIIFTLHGAKTKVDTAAADKRSKRHHDSFFWKAIPQDTFCKQVLGLLDRQSIQTLMKLYDVLECFNLGDFFCPEHGTQLSNEESECIDCVMLQIGKQRCPQCDDFEHFQLITNHCEMESCSNPIVSCLGCTKTGLCERCDKEHCIVDCSGFSCQVCIDSWCKECTKSEAPGSYCHVCLKLACHVCTEFAMCFEC